jgi:Tol biopolymer transport system component
MTVGARRFTPEVLLSAPRRSTATPSPDGTAALFTVSTYSFQTHKKSSEIRVLDINTGQTKILSNDIDASEPTWLGADNLVLWLKGGEKGTTELLAARADLTDDQ